MGIVTDIQRFSLHDGPGIRTTVFLKGCNIACAWCHNPETLAVEPELLVYPQRCAGCGACVGFDAEKGAMGLPPAREHLSLASAEGCFYGALVAAGREMSAREVVDEVAQDIVYYQTSGGGVTLSGGEVMMQPTFAKEILSLCRERGIATAVETNLAYDFSRLEKLLPLIDLVMADVKLFDDEKHKRHTGSGNGDVLTNIKKLAASGVPYILRTPVVPGVNDTADEIGRIAAAVKESDARLEYYELLNFNPLGVSKYDALGIENLHRDARPLPGEAIEVLKAVAEAQGVPVRVG